MSIDKKNVEFDDYDRAIIRSYKHVVKGIARFFGKNCEVLLHSLENYENAVVFIENGHNSMRSVGAPITDFALEFINKASDNNSFLEPYPSKFPSGDRCQSITIPILNGDKLIGLLCINLNMDISILDFINDFVYNNIKNTSLDIKYEENYSSNIDDIIEHMLKKNINSVMLDMSIPNQDKNKRIIQNLYDTGFFHLKGTVETLAERLQISTHTVYSYIKKYSKK